MHSKRFVSLLDWLVVLVRHFQIIKVSKNSKLVKLENSSAYITNIYKPKHIYYFSNFSNSTYKPFTSILLLNTIIVVRLVYREYW